MKNVHFPALGLDIPLGRFQRYQDLGFAEDPEIHIRKNALIGWHLRRFLPDILNTPMFRKIKPTGVCMYNFLPKQLAIIAISYADTGDETVNLAVRAHEETHALRVLGREDVLESALEVDQGVGIDLGRFDDEAAANIGSVYALIKRNLFWTHPIRADLYSAYFAHLDHRKANRERDRDKIAALAMLGVY